VHLFNEVNRRIGTNTFIFYYPWIVNFVNEMATVPVTVTVNNESLQFEEEFWAEAAVENEGYEDEDQKGNVTDEGMKLLIIHALQIADAQCFVL